MTKTKTYQIKISCCNCGRIQKKPVDIPKGTKWHEYVDGCNFGCDHCGCRVGMNIIHIL